jgi:hypothetical protein
MLGYHFDHNITKYPPRLAHLHYGCSPYSPIENLPDSLLYQSFHWESDYNEVITFPNNLTHLLLGSIYQHSLNNLPRSLTHLVTSVEYKIELINLPPNLKYLQVGDSYTAPLNLTYLHNLETLVLLNEVDLTTIKFSDNISYIAFEGGFFGNLTKVKWPTNLSYIVDSANEITIKSCKFPKSLYQIKHSEGISYIRHTGKHTKCPMNS